MKNFFFYFFALVLIFLFDLFIAHHLTIHFGRPSLFFLTILSAFIIFDLRESLRWFSPAVLFFDLFSSLPFGIFSLSILTTLFLLWSIVSRFGRISKGFALVLVSFLGIFFYHTFLVLYGKLFFFLHISHLNFEFFERILFFILPNTVYNLLFFVIVFKIIKEYYSHFHQTKNKSYFSFRI